jgi:DUF4097 and DUF4098 domain-containing protein YvlB
MNRRSPVFCKGVWCRITTAGLLCATLLAAERRALAAADPGQEQVSRDFQKTVTLGAGQAVRIEHKFGELKVHGESGRDVKISAIIRVQANSHDEAQSFADKIQIEVQQTGAGVEVKTVYPDEHKWHIRIGKNPSYYVNYDIAMPSDAPLNVRNSFGSTNASGIHGPVDIDNSHGSISVRDVGAAKVNNSFGNIELTGAAGATSVTDTNGSVEVYDVKGTLEVRNRFGKITAKGIQGAATINGGNGAITLSDAASANITTSFGSVDVRNVKDDLTVHDNNGNVEIAVVGGAAQVTNSFGNVTLSDVHGQVVCTTSNGRVKGSALTGISVTIHDSFGNIEVDTISGALDAETSNGRINVRDAHGAVTLQTSFGAIDAANIPRGIRATNGNGAITLADVGGDTYARTSFGSVLIERVNGNLTVENNNGSVTARNVKGDASVRTSFSGVTLDGMGGRIIVDNQNGAIAVTASHPASGCREVQLKTSFSSIRVQVPQGLGYNLSAHTSFGRISSELPVTSTGSVGGDRLNGTIGGGGCQLQLNNANGSIEITKGQ